MEAGKGAGALKPGKGVVRRRRKASSRATNPEKKQEDHPKDSKNGGNKETNEPQRL